MAKQNSYNLYKQARRRYSRIPIYAHRVDQQWQADLADMQSLSTSNNGNRYILTVVDTLSKFAFVEPVENKSADSVSKAFAKVLQRARPRKPERLQTDKGKEFFNKVFRAVTETNGIHHFASESDQKAAGAERFNRTIKMFLYRYMRSKSTENWIKVLQHFVDSYNATKHSRIKMTPNEAVKLANDPEKVMKLYYTLYGAKAGRGPKLAQKKSDLKVGQMVRLNKYKGPFVKGYWGSWTLEHFVISQVIRQHPMIVYKLKDYNGDEVKGTFYRAELEPIKENTYYIEKILKTRGKDILVKWLGWGTEYNSWIPKSNIENVSR